MAQDHRRRIEFEDKAKVVGLGDRILAALAVIWNKRLNSAVCFKKTEAKQLAQKGGLFQKDQGKTAGVARILSPNPTWRPLPRLLNQSFFLTSASEVWCATNEPGNPGMKNLWLVSTIYISLNIQEIFVLSTVYRSLSLPWDFYSFPQWPCMQRPRITVCDVSNPVPFPRERWARRCWGPLVPHQTSK